MPYTVPQFIQEESKIVGQLTLKQSLYLGIAGAIIFIIYFILPFTAFIFLAILIVGGALVFGFLKIDGIPVPKIIQNFIIFKLFPKIYIWRKPTIFPKLVIRKVEYQKNQEESSPIVGGRGKFQQLSNKIDVK